jgi:radical SAM superfamily enzyme YgiQ (UPF0313 family)
MAKEISKNIALIRVNYDSHQITPVLGIAYLASYLSANGYNPLIIDGLKNRLGNNKILEILQKKGIEIAGITCLSAYYNEVVALARLLREHGLKVIIGGVHPTFLPWQTLTESNANYVVCGEGEKALLQWLQNNASNILPGGEKIRGIYSLSELSGPDAPFETAEPVMHLDDLPYPDWDQMPPASFPPAPHGAVAKHFPIGIIFSTRGCPYSCKFCASPVFYNHKARFRSPENIVGEIKLLIEKYGVREIQFEDDNLTLRRSHIENICNLIIKNNIKCAFSCPNGIRADRIDDELIKLMKRAGFYYCALGIESANRVVLENINKKESIETIQNAINILKRNGIVSQGFFIFGLPGETKESIEETINFSLRSGLDRAQFMILDVLPGCELWNDLKGKFMSNFSKKSYKEPEWLPEGLSAADLLKAQSRAFRKFFFRPGTLFKTLRYIKPAQIRHLIKRLLDYRILSVK